MFVVVGGHSRKIGKTSVMTRVIETFPELAWTAIKISRNRYGGDSRLPFLIDEEADCVAPGDASRYLAAGAQRSYWLRAADARLPEALPFVRGILEAGRNLIVESNRLLDYLSPDLFLVVLDYSVPDFKASTRRHLRKADAFAVVEREVNKPDWPGITLPDSVETPRLPISPASFWGSQLQAYAASHIVRSPALRDRLSDRLGPDELAPGRTSLRSLD